MSGLLEIIRFELITLFKTKRFYILTLLFLLWGVISAFFIGFLYDKLGANVSELLKSFRSSMPVHMDSGNSFFELMHGKAEDILPNLMRQPFVVLANHILVFISLIPLVGLISYNIISSQLSTGFIKYETLLTSKFNIVAGRYISHLFTISVLILLHWSVVLILARRTFNLNELSLVLLSSAKSWVILTVYASFCLGLATMISSWVKSGITSLILYFVLFQVLVIIKNIHYINFLSPMYYTAGLFSSHWYIVLIDMMIFIGYGVLFMLLGVWWLGRRDL